MDFGSILGGIGRGVLAVGTGGISEYNRSRQEEQAQALGSILQSSNGAADAISKLAALGTPEAAQFAKIIADKSQLPASVQEFQALQAMPAVQQEAYRQFKDPNAVLQEKKFNTEQQQTQTVKDSAYEAAMNKTRNILQSIEGVTDEKGKKITPGLVDRIKGNTAGLRGAFNSFIPGTEATDLSADLDTLKANFAFEELQNMRDNSKTGGALGSVSEKELSLLQAAKASLDQKQSPGQLRTNIRKAAKQVRESWQRIDAAYKKDGGLAAPGEKRSSPLSGLNALPAGYKDAGNGMVVGPDGKKYKIEQE